MLEKDPERRDDVVRCSRQADQAAEQKVPLGLDGACGPDHKVACGKLKKLPIYLGSSTCFLDCVRDQGEMYRTGYSTGSEGGLAQKKLLMSMVCSSKPKR